MGRIILCIMLVVQGNLNATLKSYNFPFKLKWITSQDLLRNGYFKCGKEMTQNFK